MALDTTSLLLAVTDNLDATITASVSGLGAGASCGLLRAPWNHAAGGQMAWTEAGVATANGSGVAAFTAVATPVGFYAWAATRRPSSTTVDMLSPAVFRPVIDTAAPVHARTLDAVVGLIRSLNLSGIGSATNKVYRRWFPVYLKGVDDPDGSGGGLPQVQVSPYPREVPKGVMTNKDDVGYPVLVAFFDDAEPTYDNDIPRNLKWRRQVAAALRNQRLAGVPEVVLSEWQPDLIAAPEGLAQNYLVGASAFLFQSREDRGLIA